jgi:hypothetical protein
VRSCPVFSIMKRLVVATLSGVQCPKFGAVQPKIAFFWQPGATGAWYAAVQCRINTGDSASR